VVRGWLEFVPQDLSEQQSAQLGIANGGGVTVVQIQRSSQAYAAGVKPGDLVTAVNGETVRSAQDLVSKVAALKPGTTVQLDARHGRQPYRVELKVTERPTREAQAR
jgi:S1-C subfamily serine protease